VLSGFLLCSLDYVYTVCYNPATVYYFSSCQSGIYLKLEIEVTGQADTLAGHSMLCPDTWQTNCNTLLRGLITVSYMHYTNSRGTCNGLTMFKLKHIGKYIAYVVLVTYQLIHMWREGQGKEGKGRGDSHGTDRVSLVQTTGVGGKGGLFAWLTLVTDNTTVSTCWMMHVCRL